MNKKIWTMSGLEPERYKTLIQRTIHYATRPQLPKGSMWRCLLILHFVRPFLTSRIAIRQLIPTLLAVNQLCSTRCMGSRCETRPTSLDPYGQRVSSPSSFKKFEQKDPLCFSCQNSAF